MNRNKLIAVLGVVIVTALVGFFLIKRGKPSEESSSRPDKSPSRANVATKVPPPPAPALVAGKVTSAEDGTAIANAVVNLTSVDASDSDVPIGALAARTGSDGSFTIANVPPRRYSVAATAPGFVPERVELGVASAGPNNIDIALARGGNRLSGTITDVNSGPVSGALVRVTPVHGLLSISAAHGFAALSADDGSYSLHAGDGRYRVTAAHPDYVAESQAIELRGGNRTLDFALAPGAVVEGTVLSESTGRPVAAATVAYVRESMTRIPGGAAMAMGGRGGVTTTDGAGKFRISGLQAGAIRLSARADRGASQEPTTVPVAIAEQISGVEIYIAEAFTISGKVVTKEDGKAAAGVDVSAITSGGGERIPAIATTGADGSFVIAGVQPGKYHLAARSDDFVANLIGQSVEVDASDLNGVVVTVRRGAFITGRVEPATIADVDISLTDDLPGPGRLMSFTVGGNTVRTQADGRFRLGPLLPGDVTLTGKAADGRKGTTPVSVPESGMDDVVITLEGKASISGRVVDDKGKAVGDAIVSLKRQQGNRRVTMIVNGRDATAEQSPTHEDGSFAIGGLDAGDYELNVKDAQGQSLAWAKPTDKKQPHAPLSITLADNENRDGVVLAVEARNGIIRGVVLDPGGAPAADVWVTATPRLSLASAPAMPAPRRGPDDGEGEGEGGEERVEVMTMVMVSDDEGGGGLGVGFGGSVAPVLTDDGGRFEITGLRHGDYDLMAEGLRGSARGFTKAVSTGSNVSIRLLALTRIEGVVTLSGQPVERFHVALSGASHRAKDVRDPDGKFTMHRVDPGSYSVEVTSDDGSGTAEVAVATGKVSAVSIELVTMARITGKVATGDGQPVVGAMVLLGAGGDGEMEISMVAGEEPARTGDDGSFEVRAGPGKHLVLVLGEDSHQPLAMKPIEVVGADIDLGVLTAGQ